MADLRLAKAFAAGMSRKSIGAKESGFMSRWGWSLDSWAGKRVSVDTAMQNDAVWGCVRLISDAVAGLPLGLYQREASGGRKTATDHPLYDLLHNEPNSRMSAMNFWQAMVAGMLLWGNAYALIHRNGKRVTSLEFINPARMRLVAPRNGGPLQYELADAGGVRPLAADQVMHVRAFTLDGEIGISAIQYGYNAIGSALLADQASAETFRNASRASGIVRMGNTLTKPQRQEVREHVKTVSDQGGVYVLEAGTGYDSLKFSPADAELLASRSFSVETICRWFRTPPVMIGHGDKQSSWPTSTEAQGALFLRYVLRSFILCIEQEIRRALLTPAERLTYFAEYALEGLLRGDSAARSAFYASSLQNGWMSRNEVRRLENLPPIEGGDVLTVQSNMIALPDLGNNTGEKSARAALINLLNGQETP